MGNLKTILLEKSGFSSRIAKDSFITSVPIYGNTIPVSFAFVMQNIKIDLFLMFLFSFYT
jgi:hypothetical protein